MAIVNNELLNDENAGFGISAGQTPSSVVAASEPETPGPALNVGSDDIAAIAESQHKISPLQKVGFFLEALGAGAEGEESLMVRMQREQQLQKKRRLDQSVATVDFANKVGQQARSLPEDKRQKYMDSVLSEFEGDEETQNIVRLSAERPDVLQGMSEAIKNDPLMKQAAMNGKFFEFTKTEAGRKYYAGLLEKQYAKEWMDKSPQWVDWSKKNNTEQYEKIVKDGKVTMAELNNMISALPENMQPSEESKSYLFAPDNQKSLSALIGLEIEPAEGDDIVKGRFHSVQYELPDGTIVAGAFDTATKDATYVDPESGEELPMPPGTRKVSVAAGSPPTAKQFMDMRLDLHKEEMALRKLNKFFTTVGGTDKGVKRWANEVSAKAKTALNTGALEPEEFSQLSAKAQLQSLLGLFRVEVVGPGVMTEFDAQRVIDALGGDISALQNIEVVEDILNVIYNEKLKRRGILKDAVNQFAPSFGIKISADQVPESLSENIAAGGSESLPTVTTQEQFDKLKSGDLYIGTDGETYEKP